jgi:hypothetical protein
MAHRGRKNADDAFLTALSCGSTVENAAAKAGIGRRTAHRRLKEPEFLRRLTELKADMVKRATAMLTAAGLEGVKTIVSLQGPSNPPSVRLGAARAALELGMRFRDSTEMEERLAALEKQVNLTNQRGRSRAA